MVKAVPGAIVRHVPVSKNLTSNSRVRYLYTRCLDKNLKRIKIMGVPLRKAISAFLAIVLVSISVLGFYRSCEASERSASSPCFQEGKYADSLKACCPDCPVDERSPHHCEFCCDGACHAPLTVRPIDVAFVLDVAPLKFFEKFELPPEVYPSKFIPPESLV